MSHVNITVPLPLYQSVFKLNLQGYCVEDVYVAQTTTQTMFADQSTGRSDGQTACPLRREVCQLLLSQALSTFSPISHASYMPARELERRTGQ